ncbi:MAG: PPC domain-containing protein [Candidatus Helarchaeota archaeon]|nr:PPC domain-containing protein [Candidatus Helarchaeota archaeon]
MVRRVPKKLILISSVVFLMGIFSCLPVAAGYGTDISGAEPIGTETVIETLLSADVSAWYKKSCSNGDTLIIVMTTLGPNLDLFLYNPSQSQVAYSDDFGPTETLIYECSSSGYYYIEVRRFDSGNIMFGILALITSNIPGFELLYVFFGIVVLLGIAIHSKNKNRPFIEN